MLFMYWENAELKKPPAASAWKALYPKFKVFNDSDVVPLLPRDLVPIYKAIALPSAKSDLARLLLLKRYGGFYVDAHVGPMAPAHLLETLDDLSSHNLIVFGKGWLIKKKTDFDLMNGVLAARKDAVELDMLIDIVVTNLKEHWSKEAATADHVPYDLFSLSGTYTIVQSFFDDTGPRPVLKESMKNRVHVHFMPNNVRSGFEMAGYYTYREPGRHWSERQKHERLFSAAS